MLRALTVSPITKDFLDSGRRNVMFLGAARSKTVWTTLPRQTGFGRYCARPLSLPVWLSSVPFC